MDAGCFVDVCCPDDLSTVLRHDGLHAHVVGPVAFVALKGLLPGGAIHAGAASGAF